MDNSGGRNSEKLSKRGLARGRPVAHAGQETPLERSLCTGDILLRGNFGSQAIRWNLDDPSIHGVKVILGKKKVGNLAGLFSCGDNVVDNSNQDDNDPTSNQS